MHASKFFLVVTSLSLTMAATDLRATDTPEEAALREALRKAGNAPSAPQAAPPAAAQPAAPVQPAMPAQPVIEQPAPSPAPAAVQASAPAAVESPATDGFGSVPPPSSADDALIQALRTQPGQTVTPTAAPTAGPAVAAGAPAAAVVTPAAAAPITAPALPISATKEQRLAELLRQYKADQITPEQYHTQRAAILAGQ